MRSALFVLAGFVFLALAVYGARFAWGEKNIVLGAQIFLPLWLAVCAVNMYVGVSQAGYSVAEEAPILLMIFAPAAVVAGWVWWKLA